MQAVAQSRRVSFGRYASRRIGHGSDGEQLVNLLVRPFAAPSFAAFWRAFNPLLRVLPLVLGVQAAAQADATRGGGAGDVRGVGLCAA